MKWRHGWAEWRFRLGRGARRSWRVWIASRFSSILAPWECRQVSVGVQCRSGMQHDLCARAGGRAISLWWVGQDRRSRARLHGAISRPSPFPALPPFCSFPCPSLHFACVLRVPIHPNAPACPGRNQSRPTWPHDTTQAWLVSQQSLSRRRRGCSPALYVGWGGGPWAVYYINHRTFSRRERTIMSWLPWPKERMRCKRFQPYPYVWMASRRECGETDDGGVTRRKAQRNLGTVRCW